MSAPAKRRCRGPAADLDSSFQKRLRKISIEGNIGERGGPRLPRGRLGGSAFCLSLRRRTAGGRGQGDGLRRRSRAAKHRPRRVSPAPSLHYSETAAPPEVEARPSIIPSRRPSGTGTSHPCYAPQSCRLGDRRAPERGSSWRGRIHVEAAAIPRLTLRSGVPARGPAPARKRRCRPTLGRRQLDVRVAHARRPSLTPSPAPAPRRRSSPALPRQPANNAALPAPKMAARAAPRRPRYVLIARTQPRCCRLAPFSQKVLEHGAGGPQPAPGSAPSTSRDAKAGPVHTRSSARPGTAQTQPAAS